jgi:DNA helicase HerA-like ATPase
MHTAIYGMTLSGKSSLAKQIIANLRMKGYKTIVLDPLGDPSFNADFHTQDVKEFERVWKGSRSCFCYIDESGQVGKFSEAMRNAATTGRHWGHSFTFIAQKATQVEPLVREQCSNLFLFRSGRKSRETLAEEFDCDELLKPIKLLEYHSIIRGEYKGLNELTFKNG